MLFSRVFIVLFSISILLSNCTGPQLGPKRKQLYTKNIDTIKSLISKGIPENSVLLVGKYNLYMNSTKYNVVAEIGLYNEFNQNFNVYQIDSSSIFCIIAEKDSRFRLSHIKTPNYNNSFTSNMFNSIQTNKKVVYIGDIDFRVAINKGFSIGLGYQGAGVAIPVKQPSENIEVFVKDKSDSTMKYFFEMFGWKEEFDKNLINTQLY